MLQYLKLNREFECLYLIDTCIIYFIYLEIRIFFQLVNIIRLNLWLLREWDPKNLHLFL